MTGQRAGIGTDSRETAPPSGPAAPPGRRCQGSAGHVARLEHAPGSSHRFDLHRVRHAAVAGELEHHGADSEPCEP